LADIRTLARFALHSGDTAIMQRDLEMTIVETDLPLQKQPSASPE